MSDWKSRETHRIANLKREIAAQAARIAELETVINRYLADDFSCNGGAQRMFEAILESK